jgi:endonuclease YncB( thermonuclease family)
MRAPPLLVTGAIAAIVVFASSYLYYKSRSASLASHSETKDESKSAKQAPPTSSVSPVAGTDYTATWTALDPAYHNYKVQIGNDGSLQADKQALELYGIKILPRSQICAYRSGERWACGQRAYIALLNIVGSTTIDCRPKDTNQPRVVICHLAGTDISELMLREGWGNLGNRVIDKQYVDAAAAAINNKTGMWSLQASPKSAN